MATRETMNISLTRQLQKFIQDRIKSGRYTSASEVVREGLRLMQEREEERAAAIQSIRQKIEQGIAAADRGELIDGAEVFRELERRAKARRRKAG